MSSDRNLDVATNLTHQQPRVFFRAPTRILAWYIVLLASSTLVAFLANRSLLFARVEERIEESLTQERREFQQLAKGLNSTTNELSEEEIEEFFDVLLSRNIPDDDEFLLTLANGKLYKSSPTALPDDVQEGSEVVLTWRN